MSKTCATVVSRRSACEDRLLHTFAEAQAELTQTLLRKLGSVEDAQDAVQEVFLKCWRKRRRIAAVRNLRAWIFRVGLNAALDLQRNVWRRRSRPLPEPLDIPESTKPSPSDNLIHREALERLRLALADLRPQERAVFLLRQHSDWTYEEIADRHRAPVGTIKTQMRAALHKLRRILSQF